MPMEYRVRVKTERFEEPISRFISQDEEAVWEFAARESQPMNGEGFIEREIVFIEKQYVSGWQPVGPDRARHYMTQIIPAVEIERSMCTAERIVGYAYEKALAEAKHSYPGVDWTRADVKVTLEVTEE